MPNIKIFNYLIPTLIPKGGRYNRGFPLNIMLKDKIIHKRAGKICARMRIKKSHKDKEGAMVIDDVELLDISVGCNKK